MVGRVLTGESEITVSRKNRPFHVDFVAPICSLAQIFLYILPSPQYGLFGHFVSSRSVNTYIHTRPPMRKGLRFAPKVWLFMESPKSPTITYKHGKTKPCKLS